MGKKLIALIAITNCLLACLLLSSCTREDTAATATVVATTQPTATVVATAQPTATPSAGEVEKTPEPTPAPAFSIDADRQDAIFNHDSVGAVFLGMTKAELETVFAPGDVTKNDFTPYDDYGFFAKYYGNDTLKELVVFEKSTWETFNGISCGSTLDELIAAYGEPLSSKSGIYTYYTLNNEILKEAPSLVEVDINYLYSLSFIVENDLVNCVMLSRF